MKKNSKHASRTDDDLDIPTVTRAQMRRGTVGKYYARMMQNSNVVRIAEDLTKIFPNETAVNDALRELVHLKDIVDGVVVRPTAKRKKSA